MAKVKSGSGWYDFAGAVLGIAGLLHAFAGTIGLFNRDYIQGSPVFLEITHWSWAWIAIGMAQIVAAVMLLGGGGRIFGIVMAAISLVVVFATHSVFPHDGTVVILLDVLIIYGLTVHRPDGHAEAVPGPIHEPTYTTPPPIH